jgi:hypothetical protein
MAKSLILCTFFFEVTDHELDIIEVETVRRGLPHLYPYDVFSLSK